MRVIFHGRFRELCVGEYNIKADTAYEAIYAVVIQVPSLQGIDKIPCRILGFESVADLYRPTDVPEIHIFPDYTVGGGLLQIALGAVAIVVGAVTGQAWLVSLGISLALGGVMQLLSPAPKRDTSSPIEASRYLGAPKNTTTIGTRIPIGYGLHKVSGHFLSYDVNVIG